MSGPVRQIHLLQMVLIRLAFFCVVRSSWSLSLFVSAIYSRLVLYPFYILNELALDGHSIHVGEKFLPIGSSIHGQDCSHPLFFLFHPFGLLLRLLDKAHFPTPLSSLLLSGLSRGFQALLPTPLIL
jgi:hypothetical protein